MTFVLVPKTFKLGSIGVLLHPRSFTLVVFELTFVLTTLSKIHCTVAIHGLIHEASVIGITIHPGERTLSLGLILVELTSVFVAVCIVVDPFPLSLIIKPTSFILVPLTIPESALSRSLVSVPVAVVLFSVRVAKDTSSISHAIFPFALITASI